jgi:hypothetical protein
VTMGATLVWPVVTVLGFLFFTGLVVALGTSTTARYEFERNGARAPQRSTADSRAAHPAGSAPGRPAGTAQAGAQAVEVAVRPTTTTGEGAAWWLVGESAQVLAGPFADRLDADWAALAGELAAVAVYGSRRTDGVVAPKPSPQERAWLGELGQQLDRLPDDWDILLSDTDPLTTLLVEVAAALVEAGLPLHDADGGPAGGVSLMPELATRGVLVSWRAHDRMSLEHVRGASADAAVQQAMNAAVADVLGQLGFVVEPYGATGGCVVTALR